MMKFDNACALQKKRQDAMLTCCAGGTNDRPRVCRAGGGYRRVVMRSVINREPGGCCGEIRKRHIMTRANRVMGLQIGGKLKCLINKVLSGRVVW